MTTKNKTEPFFNKDAIYESEVVPLIELIRDICNKHGIPFVMGFCTKRHREGLVLAVTALRGEKEWVPPELALARAMMLGDIKAINLDMLKSVIVSMKEEEPSAAAGNN